LFAVLTQWWIGLGKNVAPGREKKKKRKKEQVSQKEPQKAKYPNRTLFCDFGSYHRPAVFLCASLRLMHLA
jgi:hypothetical protein